MATATKRALRPVADRVVGSIAAGGAGSGAVALTFDDGPDPRATPELLEVLAHHGARATFFMVGEAAARRPDLVRRVADEGHAIGNHTWDHPSLPRLHGRRRRAQIVDCALALAPYASDLFRPPYGDQSLSTWWLAHRLGMRTVFWNVTSEDWTGDDAGTLVDRVAPELRDGAVVLFHDSLRTYENPAFAERAATIEAVDRLVGRVGDRYRFVTLPELLAQAPPVRTAWFKHSPTRWLNGLDAPDGGRRVYPGGLHTVLARL